MMANKLIDKLVYHITVKPKRYKPVKNPPKTALGKLLHPQKARQEQYNRWCERVRGVKSIKANSKQKKYVSSTPICFTPRKQEIKPKKQNIKPKKQPIGKRESTSMPSLSFRERILLSEMKRKKLKFTLEDILFITRDKTRQLIWLEKGNKNAGLKHILDGNGEKPGHAQDFFNVFGAEPERITSFIKNVMQNGEVMYNRLTTRMGRECFERMYLFESKYYVLSGIGTNGFIVSAYPKNEKEAERLVERYGK